MPSYGTICFVTLLAAATNVSAHGFVQGIDAAGTYYTGYLVSSYPYSSSPPESISWSETATDLGFVAPAALATADIICHRGAKNAALSAPVAAGDVVTLDWNTWPESHHGPVIDYMANCNGDCATVDKTTLEWFKIDERGLVDSSASPGTWGTDELMANNNSWAVTVPSTIAAGNYVLRHEIIALHGAGSSNGAQFYPQCINLQVTGSGTDTPAGTLGEALYTETDPGILVNIYSTSWTYTVPGPTLYGSGSAATGTAAPVATSVAASISAVTSSAATAATTSAASSSQAVTSAAPSTMQTVVKSATSSSAPAATAAADEDTCE